MYTHHITRASHRRVLAAALAGAALAATAPPASAVPIGEGGGSLAATSDVGPGPVEVDQGFDWSDTGIGAAGMLTLVLIGYGGAHSLTTVAGRRRSTAV